MYSVVVPSMKIGGRKKKVTHSITCNLYCGTTFTCSLYVILPYGSILSTLPRFMKIEMAIQLSVKPLIRTLIKICSAVLKLKQAEGQMHKHSLPHMHTVYVNSAKSAQ